MRFAAMFFDNVTPSELDPDLTRAHFDYLGQHRDQITLAGGLRPPEGGAFCGSLWVIEADSSADARRLMDEDPYCLAGLRPDRRIFFWNAAPIPAQS
ncbi:YciI family protein [Brucella tritici]|uniref:YciI family protein n=1 Tax=Brucella tritici TaxID=94626 RepID=UPI001590A4FA|nr:YciI family protein [Brucella tritici]